MRAALAALLLFGCVEKSATSVPPPAGAKGVPAETEFFGEVRSGGVKAARLVFAVTRSPCTAEAADPGVIQRAEVQPGKLFHEFFFPQGTKGYACVYALDEGGRVVGHAAHARGPLTFQGLGEVEIRDVNLDLVAVSPRAAPPGL